MKKVILTKSSIEVGKLGKSINSPMPSQLKLHIQQLPRNVPHSPDTGQYQLRKSMQNQYKELFRALFKIPDKGVQQRVLDAINGVENTSAMVCTRCRVQRCDSVDNSTQTDCSADDKPEQAGVAEKRARCPFSMLVSSSVPTPTENPPQAPQETVPKLRKRRRKICLPQVIKKSHAQMATDQFQPKTKRPKVLTKDAPNGTQTETEVLKRRHIISQDTLSFLDDISWDELLRTTPINTSQEHVIETMAHELLVSSTPEEGLLPIHSAILRNDCLQLQRQIYIWQRVKEVDLNDLLTNDDKDCLQLAVENNSYAAIINILIDCGLNANCNDSHSNTIVHLALHNEVDVDSLALLMQRIDLSILLQLNDYGFTPLHLAVRHDLHLHAELLMDILEVRLVGVATYQRKNAKVHKTKQDFREYYAAACSELDQRFADKAKPKLKKKLLDAGERRSGSTALFYAVENKLDHFAFFLLAHLSDPCVPNLGGQNAQAYLCEFSKLYNFNAQIDTAMENVKNLLNKR